MRRWRNRLWSIGGALLGLAGFIWLFAGLDYAALRLTIEQADPRFLLLVPVALVAEQGVRAWKWRQFLLPLRRVGTGRLFAVIMAGYFANMVIPVGVSPLLRAWLVARIERLRMSAVLATVTVDRLVDGVIFAGLVALVVIFAAIPDPDGTIRLALVIGGGGSLALFAFALAVLFRHKRHAGASTGWLLRLADRLPSRLVPRVRATLISFADGVIWPSTVWRQAGVIAASIIIKLIAATHFLWAGLAFDVVLRPFDYLFLVAFFGFLVIITHMARVPGGFVIGAAFALGQLGVAEEPALAMVTLVMVSNMAVIAAIGAITLWRHGITIASMRTERADPGAPREPV